MLYTYGESIKRLNGHSLYLETVPLNELSGLVSSCDVTTALHKGRNCHYSAVTTLTNQSRLGFYGSGA